MTGEFVVAFALIVLAIPGFLLFVYQQRRQREFFEFGLAWTLGPSILIAAIALGFALLGLYWQGVDQRAKGIRDDLAKAYDVEILQVSVDPNIVTYRTEDQLCSGEWASTGAGYGISRDPSPDCNEGRGSSTVFETEDLPG